MHVFSRARALAMITVGVLAAALLSTTAPLAADAAADTASISGTVTLPAGVTIEDADPWVVVYGPAPSTYSIKSIKVAPDGTYVVSGLDAGDYKVHFSVDGRDRTNLAPEWYPNAYDQTSAQTISLAAGATATVSATLDIGATISGTVSGGGIGWGHGQVLAYRQQSDSAWDDWGEDAHIAADGSYTLHGLNPGSYRLSFSDMGGYGFDDIGAYRGWTEWWNDASTSGQSTLVVVTAQQQLALGSVNLDLVGGRSPWPTMAGSLQVGRTLTATPGAWPAGTTSMTYQWYADGDPIPHATSAKLVLAGAQYKKRIVVGVWGIKPGETRRESTFSGVSGPVAAGVLTAPTPTIKGTVKAGKKLTAKPGTWTSGTSLTYRWYANGKAISKATKSTFTIPKSLKGKKITVKVTGKKTGYTTVTRTSAAKRIR